LSWQAGLQFDHAAGGVVHLLYGQAEPVPGAPDRLAAGAGDRLFQLLPPVNPGKHCLCWEPPVPILELGGSHVGLVL
jgi:hypothetical protein